MHRLAVWLIAISLLCCTAPPRVSAQMPAGGSFRTIASSEYSFQVPADWQELSVADTPSTMDVMVVSPGGLETVFAGAVAGLGSGAPEPSGLAEAFFTGVNRGSLSSGGSAATVLQGPDSIQVINAEAAVALTEVVATKEGIPVVMDLRVATRGASAYSLGVVSPQELYGSDPNLRRILDSFQLVLLPASALSPEEAIISLLPYRLQPQEVPAGYTLNPNTSADSAATLAAESPSAAAAFRSYQNAGFVVVYIQWLVPTAQPTAIPGATAHLYADLFVDSSSARKAAMGDTISEASSADVRWEPTILGVSVGEASGAWHKTETSADQPAQGKYEIRWQRGQVVFTLISPPQPLGQEQQADAEKLALALDAAEQSRPALSLGPPSVTPPATERQRFQAALQLRQNNRFFAPASATPAGYTAELSYFLQPADSVSVGADPMATLHKVDERWKWVVSARQVFRNEQNHDLFLLTQATLSADPQAADADATDFTPATGWTMSRPDPHVRLGDATYAFQASGPGGNGNALEGIYLYWTHGAVALSVRMLGPAGSTSMDQVVELAKKVEARFQPAAPPPMNALASAGRELADVERSATLHHLSLMP